MALAKHLAAGRWLGAYSQFTLMKGPGYPIFLAVNSWLGLPLGLSHALFQCGAIGIFFWVVARLTGMPTLALCGFIITLWAPAPYLDRVTRDAIYPGETLLVLGALCYTFLGTPAKKRRLIWALASGLLAGWLSLTREEGVWIAPGVAIIVIFGTWVAWRGHTFLRDAMVPLVVVLLAFTATKMGFYYLNWIAYGTATSVETTHAPFKDTLAALESVDAGKRIPYVPVSRQARFAIYAVSPAFKSLKGYFDPVDGMTPWQFGCTFYPGTCGDIAGGWFLWALRDATANAGHYSSPADAAAFYRRLTSEVTQACQDRRLKCSETLFTLLPHISSTQWQKLPSSLLKGIKEITFVQSPGIAPGPSTGEPYDIASDAQFLNYPLQTSDQKIAHIYRIAGWYRSPKHDWVTGRLTQVNGQTKIISIQRMNSPDLVQAFKDPSAIRERFDINFVCAVSCTFKFDSASNKSISLDLDHLTGKPQQHLLGPATIYIDSITDRTEGDASLAIQTEASGIIRETSLRIFSIFMPWLSGISLIAMILATAITTHMRRISTIQVVSLAVWALITSRLLLLGLIDISSFPAMLNTYLAPAYVLICVVSVLSFGSLFASLQMRSRKKVNQSG